MRLLVWDYTWRYSFASWVNPQVVNAVHQSHYESTMQTSSYLWQMDSILPSAGIALGSQGNRCIIKPHHPPQKELVPVYVVCAPAGCELVLQTFANLVKHRTTFS